MVQLHSDFELNACTSALAVLRNPSLNKHKNHRDVPIYLSLFSISYLYFVNISDILISKHYQEKCQICNNYRLPKTIPSNVVGILFTTYVCELKELRISYAI
jgi:hypothetical protein